MAHEINTKVNICHIPTKDCANEFCVLFCASTSVYAVWERLIGSRGEIEYEDPQVEDAKTACSTEYLGYIFKGYARKTYKTVQCLRVTVCVHTVDGEASLDWQVMFSIS